MGLLDFGIESEISTYSEYRLSNRRRLVKAILLIGFPLIAVFLAADLFVGGGNTTAYVTFGLAVIFTALLLVYIRTGNSKREDIFYNLLLRLLLLFFGVYLVYTIGVTGKLSRLPWFYVFPMLLFYSVTLKEGLLWMTVLIAFTVLALFGRDFIITADDITALKIRFLVLFAAVGFISCVSSYSIRAAMEALFSKQTALKDAERHSREAYERLQVEIEERKRAEGTLKKSEHRHRTLIDTMNEGLVEVDENWGMTFINDRFAEMIGYSREQLIGRRFYEFASEAYKAKAQKEHTSRRQGKTGSYELELVRADGEKIFVFCSPKASYDSEGNYLGGLGVVADITMRKEMEEQLRVSEKKYRFLAENMADMVWTLDRDFRTTYVSSSIEKMLGFTAEERKQQSIEETVTPESLQEIQKRFMEELQRDKEDGVALNRSIIIEVAYYRKDGSTVWMENRVQAIRDSENAIVGIFGVSRDIAERKQAEEALLRAQKMEAIGTLAGGIAHDFNNLMTSVLGNISLARMEMKPESKAFRNLVEAEKASIQTKELTARLITFSEGGGPVKETVSIGDLVKDSVGSSLKGSDINARFSIPDDISPVEADEEQMKQVIHNVVTNAQEAMAGQGSINVSCENIDIGEKHTLTLKDGQYVKISIKDQGPGIPKKDLTKIFDPYFSTKEMGAQKGMGLGLAVSDSIVRKHDGLITVESELGTGTTLSIYLPAASAERQTPSAKRLEVDSQSTINNRQSTIQRILVMDDEEIVRNVTAALLGYIGYEVELAVDGAEAIKMYKEAGASEKPYDAVILDLTNKIGMGGVETIKRLLEIDPDVKAIVATGYSNDPIISNFREHGFCGSLSKPFSMDDLKTALHDAIAGE